MQAVINYFAGLDKKTVRDFVTVVGILTFFALTVLMMVFIAFKNEEAMMNTFYALLTVGLITGTVGWKTLTAD